MSPYGSGIPAAALNSLPAAKEQAGRRTLDRYSLFHRLVPAQGEVDAFWVVDPGTGTTLAVDLDGFGGSRAFLDGDLSALYEALNLALLVPDQATFALSTTARRRRSSAWRVRQMM
ncbi:hypothetical protein [Microtetraspora malaysiensis]|uniref:hypothetical protein n=1 Tax=Microtetraspora malaysiensis TaxID=161358 RepID=UPI003D8BBBC1